MTVYYNLVDDEGNVVEGPISYPEVKIRTGLKDQVGLDELGWKEHFEPAVAFVYTDEIIARYIRNHQKRPRLIIPSAEFLNCRSSFVVSKAAFKSIQKIALPGDEEACPLIELSVKNSLSRCNSPVN